MAVNYKFIIALCFASGLALCWYPLGKLQAMQIENSQLLFFAFASASIVSIGFMANQVAIWRKKTLELLIYALIGGVSIVLLHYAILLGHTTGAISIFSASLLLTLFLIRLIWGHLLAVADFFSIVLLVISAGAIVLASTNAFIPQWWQLLAVLAGMGFCLLSAFSGSGEAGEDYIPIMSKVAAVCLAGTWLVGTVLILSPRSTSFPQDHAAIFSALYGIFILLPVIMGALFLLMLQTLVSLLLWLTVLLSINCLLLIVQENLTLRFLLGPMCLLGGVYGVQLIARRSQIANALFRE